MKTKLLLAAALVAAIPAAAPAQQRVPAATILVVDTTRVGRECTACVAANTAMQAQENSLRARGQALAAPIQAEETSISQAVQAAQRLTGAARTNAENALRPRIEAFNQRRQAAAQELQTLQQNLQSTQVHVSMQVSQRLQPIFNQIMASRGANLVISADARLAHAPALDVTNEVLAALNQQLPAVSVTPMPQQQAPAGQQQPPRPGGR